MGTETEIDTCELKLKLAHRNRIESLNWNITGGHHVLQRLDPSAFTAAP